MNEYNPFAELLIYKFLIQADITDRPCIWTPERMIYKTELVWEEPDDKLDFDKIEGELNNDENRFS